MSSSSDNVPLQQSSPLVAVDDDHLAIQPRNSSPISQDSPQSPQNLPDSRPFIMYSCSQLLFLHKSPLVQLPYGMPALKDWFGFVLAPHTPFFCTVLITTSRTENDQSSSKKDSETPLSVGNTRDRRCVVQSPSRVLIDMAQSGFVGTPMMVVRIPFCDAFILQRHSQGSARQSFRGAAITQPSQMGNFKHQSIRAADRDRDKDAEKELDRERVKEGQERLRNASISLM